MSYLKLRVISSSKVLGSFGKHRAVLIISTTLVIDTSGLLKKVEHHQHKGKLYAFGDQHQYCHQRITPNHHCQGLYGKCEQKRGDQALLTGATPNRKCRGQPFVRTEAQGESYRREIHFRKLPSRLNLERTLSKYGHSILSKAFTTSRESTTAFAFKFVPY